jgi:predicted Rossmann-fold nucleotide-binding protein
MQQISDIRFCPERAGGLRSVYEETKRTAAALAEMGCDIITGSGIGLMKAANEQAAFGPEPAKSIGIRIELPFQQEENAFITQTFQHRTFFTRLHQFVLASNAYVVAPGIGTMLETLMMWHLLQVQHLQKSPLILVGQMWPGRIEWVRSAMLSFDPPLTKLEDITIPECVQNAEEAIGLIRKHHDSWLCEGQS